MWNISSAVVLIESQHFFVKCSSNKYKTFDIPIKNVNKCSVSPIFEDVILL